MTDIKSVIRKEVIADIYEHKWNDDLIFAKSFSDQRRVNEEFIQDFVERNDYRIELFEQSDVYMKIINEYRLMVCDECESKAMYDSKNDEWYCPVCCE